MIPMRFASSWWWVGCLWLLLAAELPAQTLLDQLERRLSDAERVEAESHPNARPTLGIAVATVTESAAAKYGLPVRQGALVARVDPTGVAAQQGIRMGDVVVAFKGRRIDTPHELVAAMTQTRAGETVELTWYSGRRLARKTVQLPGEIDPFAVVPPPTTTASPNSEPRDNSTGSGDSGAKPASRGSSGEGFSGSRPSARNNVANSDLAGSGSTDPFAPGLREPLGGRQAMSDRPGPVSDPAAPGLLGGSQLAEPAGRLADRLEASGRPLLGRLGQLIDRVAAEAQLNETTDPTVAPALRTAPLPSAPLPSAAVPPAAPQRSATAVPTPASPPATLPSGMPTNPSLEPPTPVAVPTVLDNAALIAELNRVSQLVVRLQRQIEQLEQRLQTLENVRESRP